MTNERKSEPEKGLANDKFLLDEVGNRIPLSEVKAGTRLRFLRNPDFAHGNPDPEYLDDNAPDAGEIRTIDQYSGETDYLKLASTTNKGVYYIRPSIAQTHSRIIG